VRSRAASFATSFAASLLLALSAVLIAPGAALACAVCFQAQTDASRIAFIASTAAMTVLPLAMIGCFVWWVRSRFRKATSARAARQTA